MPIPPPDVAHLRGTDFLEVFALHYHVVLGVDKCAEGCGVLVAAVGESGFFINLPGGAGAVGASLCLATGEVERVLPSIPYFSWKAIEQL